jgi:hypothetical protein
MAQAVNRRTPTAEARLRSKVSPCGICDVQSCTGTGFSPSTSVFLCQFHSTGAPLLRNGQKTIIIFIIGLYKKPQGRGASVASAGGPFTTKKRFVEPNCMMINKDEAWTGNEVDTAYVKVGYQIAISIEQLQLIVSSLLWD